MKVSSLNDIPERTAAFLVKLAESFESNTLGIVNSKCPVTGEPVTVLAHHIFAGDRAVLCIPLVVLPSDEYLSKVMALSGAAHVDEEEARALVESGKAVKQ